MPSDRRHSPWREPFRLARRTCKVHPTRGPAAAAFVLFLLSGIAAAAPVIDRVLAVVQGAIVTLSDVQTAMALGLVNTAGADDPVGSALEQLIERSLQLIEVERYSPPEPTAAEVQARLRPIRARFPDEESFRRTAAALGLTDKRLQAIARDDLRLRTYLTQRFALVTDPADEEIARYYRGHQQEFVRDGVPLTLGEVVPEVRRRLVAARRAELVDEWSRQLRQRADVLVIPR